jgi:hypothetical protein
LTAWGIAGALLAAIEMLALSKLSSDVTLMDSPVIVVPAQARGNMHSSSQNNPRAWRIKDFTARPFLAKGRGTVKKLIDPPH